MKLFSILLLSLALFIALFLSLKTVTLANGGVLNHQGEDLIAEKPENFPIATFAGGCFWCLESEIRALNGVLYTRAGYEGGAMQSPTYHDVTTGTTGHAEVVEVTFDPSKISYEKLVEFFLTKAHDPTQINRQGVDVGTQYRSEIFVHDEQQEKIANDVIARINAQKIYKNPIATRVSPSSTFWEAEEYHQQYYEKYERANGQPHIRVFLKQKNKTSQ